jgi:hypothetical protein
VEELAGWFGLLVGTTCLLWRGSVVLSRQIDALTEDAVSTMAEGSGIAPAELHRRTGGNPFFVTEVLADGRPDGVPGRCATSSWAAWRNWTQDRASSSKPPR